ncbi:hypothetical protein [Endozoicomonas sp.]|uniref:hypothetical protein n=1 Tax=Endozoicomonas sp. TaxID=1892382 RepID=UPI003AF4B6E0
MNISERVTSELANYLCEKISQKVIRLLQKRKDLLSGDQSTLKTTWDEICVQVQGDESYYWGAYDHTVCSLIEGYLEELQQYELVAISLQTDEIDYEDEPEWVALSHDDLASYIARNYVYAKAMNWSNHRITAYLDSFCEYDGYTY